MEAKSVLAMDLKDVSFRYGTSSTAFGFHLSELTIKSGERVALVGASGSGKSTLLGLITGVLTPQQGRVSIFGHAFENLGSAERDRLRSKLMGIIFQQFNLLPYLSLIDNVVLALDFAPQDKERPKRSSAEKKQVAREMLGALGLDETTMEQQQASSLSVGQQQRVAAARAFVGKPPLIIADEPTSALDEGRQNEFLQLLFDQQDATGATLLMVTHDRRIANQFDRVIDLAELVDVSRQGEAA